MFYIHKYSIGLCYGGPEEGGWWYTDGNPVDDWTPESFDDEEQAWERCRELNADEKERAAKEEDYEFTSVLASRSDHFSYTVEETKHPNIYPLQTRPYYC